MLTLFLKSVLPPFPNSQSKSHLQPFLEILHEFGYLALVDNHFSFFPPSPSA